MTSPDYFSPSQKSIASISQGRRVVITTFTDHNFLDGLIVRVVIPGVNANHPFVGIVNSLGMPQMNGLEGKITVLTPTSFSLPIDSTFFDPYVMSAFPSDEQFVGQVIPIAENAFTLTSATKNNNNIIPEIYGTSPSPYSNYTP